MTDRSPDSDAPFSMRLRLARAALLWERVWPACWPALAVLGTFLVLGLFDLLPLLPGVLHAALLLVSGAAFVVAVAAITRRIVFPDRYAARRRIERASGPDHRPLQALADRPSTAVPADRPTDHPPPPMPLRPHRSTGRDADHLRRSRSQKLRRQSGVFGR